MCLAVLGEDRPDQVWLHMSWLPYAALAAALTSVIAILDKVLLERLFRDGWSYIFLVSVFNGLYAWIVLVVRLLQGKLPPVPWWVFVVAVLPGLLGFIGGYFHTQALLRTDAAVVSALNQIVPFFALLWSVWLLGDSFAPQQYLGVAVVVLCCALLGLERDAGSTRHRLNVAVWWVLVAALLRSVGDLAVKLTLASQDVWGTYGLGRLVLLPIASLMLTNRHYRLCVTRRLRSNGTQVVLAMAGLELLAFVAQWLGIFSYSRGPLPLVSSILHLTPVFVLAITWGLNGLKAGLIPERANGQNRWTQLMLVSGVVLGAWLLR